MQRINVRLDERIKEELEAEARERGVRPSDVVREALEEHIKHRALLPSCLDIARRIRLIGCVKGLPEDLSSNRGHLEGFGRG